MNIEKPKKFSQNFSSSMKWLFIGLWGPSISNYRSCKFRHLLSEYYARGGTENESSPSELGAIIKLYKEHEDVDWNGICLLELAIIKLLDKPNLILKESHMRARYKSIADDDHYLAYEQASIELNDKSASSDEILRQQTAYLANQLYWTYSVATKGHKIRTRASLLVTYVFVAILAYMLVISSLGSTHTDIVQPYSAYYLVFTVICFGAFGAYVSFQRRMAGLRIQSESYMAFLQLRSSYFDGIAALFSGSLFALLFVVLWQSETLKLIFNNNIIDSVLPSVAKNGKDIECIHSITGLFTCLRIDSIQDFSKLLVMSFFAGFAEKFVPDAIDRLVGKAQQFKT
ncbi:hypothetical protein [Methylobacter sp. YRD-M1]|uniref:hypothetical protein n=1 Tax=Methylobacter sp. YRD-M1 TaxID=2911520 RepID=UPI00227D2255|nr:hypothetical protein [Methylobacter sp. YRD-M1]WAK02453.1 hypothetical protein LZ558_01320 [Methylobacter sp. YRD-M1]